MKDQQGSEVQFKPLAKDVYRMLLGLRIKKTTPLRKLSGAFLRPLRAELLRMDAYCSRLGLQASQVRFMVDGERIAADDTAEKLGLEDEDAIRVRAR